MIQKRATLLALALLGGVVAGSTAQAQVILRPFYYGGTWSGPVDPYPPAGPRRLGVDEIFEEVSDQGYSPLRVVGHARGSLSVEALDRRQRRVVLTVDAFDGEVLGHRVLAPAARGNALVRELEPREREQTQPRRKTVQAPRATPPLATPAPQGTNPAARRNTDAGKNGTPVAPARDPSQWGKEG